MTWEKVKLGDYCESIADGDHQAPPKAECGIPFITISNFTSYNDIDFSDTLFVPEDYYNAIKPQRKAQAGDILYSVVGSFGIPIYLKSNKKFAFQRHVAILRPSDKINGQFLYYAMCDRSFYNQADAVAVGAAQRTVSLSALRNMTIELPPRDVQDKIAGILSKYDELIENRRKQIALLEEAAQRLYREWFVDFRFPGSTSHDSIPQGWRITTLDKVCDVISGGTPSKAKSEYYCSDGIAWITPKDLSISKNKFISHGEADITEEGYRNSSARLMPKGTVLFSSRAPIGYVAIASNELCTNQGFKSLVPIAVGSSYLYYYLKNNTDKIAQQATGSTFKEVNGALMKRQEIVVPPQNLLDIFENNISQIFRKQEVLEKEISSLISARDKLLPKLMSGELKV
jgi:type I restriction enzyme S subunit